MEMRARLPQQQGEKPADEGRPAIFPDLQRARNQPRERECNADEDN